MISTPLILESSPRRNNDLCEKFAVVMESLCVLGLEYFVVGRPGVAILRIGDLETLHEAAVATVVGIDPTAGFDDPEFEPVGQDVPNRNCGFVILFVS